MFLASLLSFLAFVAILELLWFYLNLGYLNVGVQNQQLANFSFLLHTGGF